MHLNKVSVSVDFVLTVPLFLSSIKNVGSVIAAKTEHFWSMIEGTSVSRACENTGNGNFANDSKMEPLNFTVVLCQCKG